MREALAKGRSAEYVTAMEALGVEAEAGERWVQGSLAYAFAAVTAIQLGQLQKAINHGSKALELAQKAKDGYHAASAILIVADAYGRIGQLQKESQWAHRALAIAKRIKGDNRDLIQGRAYQQLGENFLRQRMNKEAVEYLSYAVTAWDARLGYLKSPAGVYATNLRAAIRYAQDNLAICLHRLGTAYLRSADSQEAAKAFERGLAVLASSELKASIETSLVMGLGQAYLAQKDFARATETLSKALQLAETRRQTAQVQTAAASIGGILLQAEKPAEAIPYYKKAIDAIESTRSLLESEEFRTSFFGDKGRVYGGMILAELGAKDFEEAFNYSERARSRAFLDILGNKVQLGKQTPLVEEQRGLEAKISLLQARVAGRSGSDAEESETDNQAAAQELAAAQKAYSDFLSKVRKENKEQASLMNVEPLALKQVQEMLQPGVTSLEYFVLQGQTALWVVEKDRINFVRLPIDRKALVSKVGALRETINQVEDTERFKQASQELYQILIQPALPLIKGKELLIIPHDVLHYLPFQALLSPEGRFLIQDYPMEFLSSASLMQFTRGKRRASRATALAFGNPDLGDPAYNLRFAEREVKEIAAQFPKSAVYVRSEATESRAVSLSPNYDIIHFAVHGELKENNPLESGLLLAKEGDREGKLTVSEIFTLNLKADLVVLSACETGLGKISSGDEVIGLPRAFIYAGTPSVVTTLWKVNDRASYELMSAFYANLKIMNKSEALRQAQLKTMKEFPQPFFWAAYGLTGEP
jgi:CHAT domain-containing protein